jgi:hypothetical protein
MTMKMKLIAAALFLLSTPMAFAEPMKCSGEQKTCAAQCAKAGVGIQVKNCTEECRTSHLNCVRTGCWANAGARYCGLMKQ